MLRTHPAFCKLKAIRLAEVNQVCPPRLPATPSPLMSPTHTRDETEIDDMMIVETSRHAMVSGDAESPSCRQNTSHRIQTARGRSDFKGVLLHSLQY